MATTLELRLHGRGGQGGVTCAKILASVHGRLGLFVQTFGDYAGERTGAPVRAYTRVADRPIANRNKVYRPHRLLVLDPSLLGPDTVAGLRPGGTLLLNTPEPLSAFDGRYEAWRLAVVDATEIARRHGIGTRSVIIVNTTIAGAYVRAHDVPFSALEAVYADLGLSSNLPAAREAWERAEVREPRTDAPSGGVEEAEEVVPDSLPDVLPLTEHVSSGPTGLRTGSWSTQAPRYVERLAPCNAVCPAGNDVVGFVQALARGGPDAAWLVLSRSTPLPGVCGRVCPAPCMDGCNRRALDGAVQVRGLERWVADHASRPTERPAVGERPLQIAVVGSGPAGLAAAQTLARAGHRATLFEREPELGGVLRTGIPAYRLPRHALDRDVQGVLDLGVETRVGRALDADALESLLTTHAGVVVATGLQRGRDLDVPGADLDGVEQGTDFLHRVNSTLDPDGVLPSVDGTVLVLGGGNTAIDCSRSALRAGASRVILAYRRSRLEMPAIPDEVFEAEEEGVEFLLQRQPLSFSGEGRVASVRLAEVELGEEDASGRRRPVVTTRAETVPCDHVLLALGQDPDRSLLPKGWKIVDGRAWREDRALPVFAAGDLATGEGTVAHAIGSGRRAAGLLLRALGEEGHRVFERPERADAVPASWLRLEQFERHLPTGEIVEPASMRDGPSTEVRRGLPDANEALRCFSCGHCSACDTCLLYCPEGVIRRRETDGSVSYEIDEAVCKGCGLCAEECPRSALVMETR